METNKVYAVYNDLSYENFIDIKSAINSNPYLIFKERFRDKIQSHFNDNYFYHYDWFIFDNKGELTLISERKWKIFSIFDELQRGYYLEFKISDPKGKIENYTIKYTGIEAVIEGIKYLREISKYENWDYFNLHKENNRLTKENEELKEELFNLKNK